jgi:Protein of unknown function (DUF3592)
MNGAFLLLFACLWSTLVIGVDGFIGRNLWRQYKTRSDLAAPGQITFSRVTRHHTSKGGTTYGVDIRYQYRVNDRGFDGTRFRYNNQSSSDWAWAQQTVARYAVGTQTQVFYSPQNPQDAVLSPGVEGADLMMFLFLMPFNMVTLGFLTWTGGWLRERIFKPVAGGVRIISDGPRTSVRLPEYGALVWAMVAVGALSFVSIFSLGFASRFRPSVAATLWVLGAVAVAGAAAYWRQWGKLHSGDDDLILDESAGTMDLPETYGRKERVTVTLSEIEKLTMETVEHRNSKGGVSYTYAPTLWLRGGTGQKLADWSDQLRAGAFTDWLSRRLGLTNVPSARV